MKKQVRPPLSCSQRAGEFDYGVRSIASFYPTCKLNDTPIVDDLPKGCPMRSDKPSELLSEHLSDGFSLLGSSDNCETRRGQEILHGTHVCTNHCIGKRDGTAHPHFRHVREALRLSITNNQTDRPAVESQITSRRTSRGQL